MSPHLRRDIRFFTELFDRPRSSPGALPTSGPHRRGRSHGSGGTRTPRGRPRHAAFAPSEAPPSLSPCVSVSGVSQVLFPGTLL